MPSVQEEIVTSVPIINISSLVSPNPEPADLANTINEVKAACRDWGFFYIVGHGVDPDLIARYKELGREFFHKPTEFKRSVARSKLNLRGFTDNEFTDGKQDWREIFEFTSDEVGSGKRVFEVDANVNNQWPEGMPEFREVLNKYYENMLETASKVVNAIFASLGISREEALSYFTGTRDSTAARFNYYPDCPEVDVNAGAYPHTDGSAITVVLQEDNFTSLQTLKDGKYYDVVPVPGSFVVNIGDMMQVWSNDLYMAPTHRVLANQHERLSTAFSYNPSNDCVVKPLATCVSPENPARFKAFPFGEFRTSLHLGDFAGVKGVHGRQSEPYRIISA